MKRNNSRLSLILFALLAVLLVSCVKQEAVPPSNEVKADPPTVVEEKAGPAQLPVRFQSPSYFIQDEQAADALGIDAEEYQIKVGANITSTKGPQPLWDILKRVANLKGMSVSWASDVDQNVLVDVDISAEDNFFEAIDNMLRQVDYFHEVESTVIVVKYRETRKYNIPLPHMKGSYTSNIGGNFLAGREAATGTEGTVKVVSDGNAFDVWTDINKNLETIIQQWRTQQTVQKETITADETDSAEAGESEQKVQQATRRITLGSSYYTINQSIGLITVTAPRPLLEKVELYIDTLKKELFRQVVIEAKIIEVYLQDNSRIGIDWSQVLKNFNLTGLVEFGTGGLLGQVWPWNPPDDRKPGANYPTEYPDKMVYKVSMQAVPFNVMLNALNEQGEATVLSNPKITVMNGQPAVISVGTDITYIDAMEVDVDEFGTRTYTATTDSVVEGVAFGVMASIVDDNSVIMHLTPITTDLVGDNIEYRPVGLGEIGLPVVQVREMSTMVQVNNGEMLIIGGLIDSSNRKTEEFAPVLGDIPLIRYLFGVEEKIKEKRELVILLTPKIM